MDFCQESQYIDGSFIQWCLIPDVNMFDPVYHFFSLICVELTVQQVVLYIFCLPTLTLWRFDQFSMEVEMVIEP